MQNEIRISKLLARSRQATIVQLNRFPNSIRQNMGKYRISIFWQQMPIRKERVTHRASAGPSARDAPSIIAPLAFNYI